MNALLLATEQHWDGPWWGGLIILLFFALLFALLIFKVFWFVPWRWRHYRGDNSDSILKQRLARGEISEDDYRRLRSILAE